jgi:2-polyprenyl-6-methoxyphenol hydroxylase-like FAD-dependent oxidoreductase
LTSPAEAPAASAPPRVDVLVCGAGPTGLVLALALHRAGVRVKVVDKSPEPGTASRALVVHARTLELYRQLGIADAFLREGLRFDAANLWVRGRPVARVKLGDIGAGISAYPYMLVVPQDRHERFLAAELRRAGLEVERGVEVRDMEPLDDGVRVKLLTNGSESVCQASYVAGCDGARSRTRELLGVGFPGNTYSHVFYVVDVDAVGPVMNDELHVALDDSDFVAVFPLLGGRTGRLIGTLRETATHDGSPLTWDDVSRQPLGRLGIGVERVNGFSTYQVHHRVAERFHSGRVFLLGDAAHIHSPVGAQGMNTGIGDAVNLAWKLAEVLTHGVNPALLDSYALERSAFARRLVATTDRAFALATSPGRLARFVRTRVVPRVLPPLVRRASVRRFMFRALSQTSIHYRGSPLSAGEAGRIHGGDRLPWISFAAHLTPRDNHEGLDGRSWQVHVYGEVPTGVPEACAALGLPLRAFAWLPEMSMAGLLRNAVYLIRPDGHVALAEAWGDPARLRRFWAAMRERGRGEVT